ncbi:hypothetical protein ACIQRS_20445 [Streptomyces termitum]|uniref:Uncharacterized protein n=1 Tax=Streptomyces termitum TaxID=67368 RepID=A0A918T2M2_9ACTN|nr:hypothetical protein [Streptomyces termitum]GHA85396.1 hypothetical protein GCM10010305_31470 [Streptomyces termitum]
MEAYAYEPATDRLFGEIRIALDHEAGILTVDGDGVPCAEIRRSGDAPPESHVPIGTRDPERLALSVDGAEEVLRPAKGFLTRRSYRVEAGPADRGPAYLLVPDSLGTSRLLRDGRLLGVFTSTGDGTVDVTWAPASDDAPPEPRDAAVGYALAAAFGTGAEPMWKLTLDALLELWP